jgi:hypothetical protein
VCVWVGVWVWVGGWGLTVTAAGVV